MQERNKRTGKKSQQLGNIWITGGGINSIQDLQGHPGRGRGVAVLHAVHTGSHLATGRARLKKRDEDRAKAIGSTAGDTLVDSDLQDSGTTGLVHDSAMDSALDLGDSTLGVESVICIEELTPNHAPTSLEDTLRSTKTKMDRGSRRWNSGHALVCAWFAIACTCAAIVHSCKVSI